MTRPWSAICPWSYKGLLFIPIAKNAHRSIVRAIKEAGGKKEYWNALPTLPRVVLMREPMDRAFSAYRMLATEGQFEGTFEHFLNTFPKSDMHVRTQWESMGCLEPDILIKWDFVKLSETLGLDAPHIGEGNKLEFPLISLDTKAAFDEYYKRDYELWNYEKDF